MSKNYLYNNYLYKWRKEDQNEDLLPYESLDLVELNDKSFKAWTNHKHRDELLAEVKVIMLELKPLDRNILLENISGTAVADIAKRLNKSRQHVHKVIADAMSRIREKIEVAIA